MPSLATLVKQRRFRGLLVGYPKAGKTGALACLANAGFRLRILDFDQNLDPLFEYVRPENYDNVDVVMLGDAMRMGPEGPEPIGKPEAFAKALRLLDNWQYTASDGQEVNFGPLKTWGPRDILVGDSMSGMVRAALNRVARMNGRPPGKLRKQDWGSAVADVNAVLEKATAGSVNANVIFTAHLTVVSPREEEEKDSDTTKELKAQLAELLPPRLFPAAVTKQQSRQIAEHFPALLLVEQKVVNGKVKRVIKTVPQPDFDIGLPLVGIPDELPVETGLLTIFNKLLPQDVILDKAAA